MFLIVFACFWNNAQTTGCFFEVDIAWKIVFGFQALNSMMIHGLRKFQVWPNWIGQRLAILGCFWVGHNPDGSIVFLWMLIVEPIVWWSICSKHNSYITCFSWTSSREGKPPTLTNQPLTEWRSTVRALRALALTLWFVVLPILKFKITVFVSGCPVWSWHQPTNQNENKPS